jgi:hypothetical protein
VVCIGLIILGAVGLKAFAGEINAPPATEAASRPSEQEKGV